MDGSPTVVGDLDAGARHEASLELQGARKAMGAYYTPPSVVGPLLDLALDPVLAERASAGPEAVASLRVIDPSCGAGNVLVAVAERIAATLRSLGVPDHDARAVAAGRCVRGVDLDPEAVALTRRALTSMAGHDASAAIADNVRCGDALADPRLAEVGTFDVVVGNPPFQSQLAARTARTTEASAALRARFGRGVGSYTDPAAAFMVLAVLLARPDRGVAALVEPMSFLTTRGAAGARAMVLEVASLTDLWVVGPGAFDASVEVCVPVLRRDDDTSPVRLHRGADRAAGPEVPPPGQGAGTWSALLAAHEGLPRRTFTTHDVLGSVASATADFRDQYYGLVSHVVDCEAADDAAWPPLVTTGLIDPAVCRWGHRRSRFQKVSRLHPRVDLAGLEPRTAAWARSRLVPKVLVATQTRVLEAVVDDAGRFLPSVPVISVVAGAGDLWHVGAVLTCPAVSLVAAHRHLGSGMSAATMRLRAQEVLELPLPADRGSWDAAAAALRDAPTAGDRRRALATVAGRMNRAYGVADDDELTAWWFGRMPGG